MANLCSSNSGTGHTSRSSGLFISVRRWSSIYSCHWSSPGARDNTTDRLSSITYPSYRACAVPNMMPRIQVDTGAIKFVLGGANVMCPGITNPGGAIPVELPEGAPVAVYAQGKEHAMAIGFLKMSTADM